MREPNAVRSRLWVEGRDDQHALMHLLTRHGLVYEEGRPSGGLPEIRRSDPEGREGVLESMDAIRFCTAGQAMGFVLDANRSLDGCWQSVRDRLGAVGVAGLPSAVPSDGYVGESTEYQARVGVWIMPDNAVEGALESFLETLISDGDAVYRHARKATGVAKGLGARFREIDTAKANLHAWLAWQKNPGRPYGVAVRSEYFGHDSPEARAFVGWFRRLYRSEIAR